MSDRDGEGQPAAKRQKVTEEGEDTVIPDSEDELYDDDLDLEGIDWGGELLPDEQDRAAEGILSPSQQPNRSQSSQGAAGPTSSPLKQVTALSAVQEEDENMLWDAVQGDGDIQLVADDAEQDDEDFAAQEAAIAARYGFAIEQLKGPQPTTYEHGNTPAPVSFGFTSARGKAFAAPSEAALLKAQELHNRSSPEAANASTSASTSKHATADDSGFADTPTSARTKSNLFAPASLVQSVGRNGNSAFKAPSINAETATGVRPDLRPLRFGPKNGHTLLPARAPSVAPTTILPAITAGSNNAMDHSDAFTSGSGAPVSMPSKQQAEALMLQKESERDNLQPAKQNGTLPGLSLGGGGAFSMPSKAAIDKEKGKAVFGPGESPAGKEGDAVVGLTSGSGAPVAGPSGEAINASNARLASSRSSSPPKQDFGGLTSGSGRAIAGPSEEAIAKSNARLSTENAAISDSTGLTSGSGKTISLPSKEAITNAVFNLDKQNDNVPSTPSRPALLNKNANLLPSAPEGFSPAFASPKPTGFKSPASVTLKKPFRPPTRLADMTAAPTTPIRSSPVPGSQAAALARTQPRLNLEMAPRNTPSSAINRASFRTPFKNGQRPTEQLLQSLHKETMAKNVEPGTMLGTAPTAVIKELEKVDRATKGKQKKVLRMGKDSVFDVYTKVPRKDMEQYGLNPCYRIDDLIDAGLPQDLIFLTFKKCEDYKFDKQFGYELAFEELAYYSDCKNLSQDWVKNHYTLIVWKLGGIAKAKTDEWAKWWSFELVCDQLKYRYEREILLSQRSCIKRIQERDSAASSPMILVVTQIIYEDRVIPPEPGSDEELQGVVTTEPFATQLEFSDGWYRIRTNVDESMYRGIWFGKIFSGLKIAVQGAKVEAGSDGADPLEGLESSTLTISGNSTSRVSWQAKLGFQKTPYVCAFRSLLPDGGFVPFVDIVITRIYVRGFKGEYVEGGNQDVWDEKEEAERKKLWEKEREKAQHDVQAEQNKALQKLCDLHQLLLAAQHASAASSVKKESIASLADFTDVFNRLEDEPLKAPIIVRMLDREVLEDTAAYAQRRIEAFGNDVGEQARREVDERCPPRVVKSFVIVRAKDFHERDPDNSRDCCLNITDPAKLGEGFLAEGRRYLISNLFPSRPSSWSSPQAKSGEIFLSTRFDSKWQAMPV